ncbi:hypothetical protein ACFSKS_23815 [Pseudocitrobacter faecalis]
MSGVQNISFGNVNPLSSADTNTSMTFNYSCTKELGDLLAGVTICFNIGASANSGQVIPRRMAYAGHLPGHSIISFIRTRRTLRSGAANIKAEPPFRRSSLIC